MRLIVVAAIALLLVPWRAGAQSIEISGGAAFPLAQPSSSYETSYVPPIQYISDFSGRAGQRLTIDRERRLGLWGALALFPVPRFGVEARVRYRTAPLDATTGPHDLSLTYTSRQPPDYVPRQHTIQRSETQPDPEGDLTELAFDLSAVGRFGDSRRVQVRISGGVTLTSIAGDFRPINFSHFQMGGHSVLMSDQHRVALEFSRTWGLGAVGGLELHRDLTSRVGLVVGARFVVPRLVDAPVRVTDVEESLLTPTPADVQLALRPAPFRMRPWTFDMLVGIRLSL